MQKDYFTELDDTDICFVIWSQEKNKEILELTINSWLKVAESLNLKIYVVTDDVTSRYEKILYKQDCWQVEWSNSLTELKNRGYTNIISILDDFLLTSLPSSIDEIKAVLKAFYENQWTYLSLVPHPNAISIFGYENNPKVNDCYKVEKTWKYRNSLQVSVWNIEHMLKVVEKSKNIWFFEDAITGVEGYYCVSYKLLNYRHIVEKGFDNLRSTPSYVSIKK